ncbi:MAG: hypothetical protein ACTSYZ_05845 [Candidatus Helarchaeota archaeon]
MIQNLLILKKSGENIYHKAFGHFDMDETVMSGFFSAFFVFSQALCGTDINTMELGTKFKIVFDKAIHKNNEIIFAAICDVSDSIINVHKTLESIKNYIIFKYGEKINKVGCDLKCYNDLDSFIEKIIYTSQELDIDRELYKKAKEILKDLDANDEILDSALISSTGVTSSTDKDKEFLNLMIKQMDAFFKLTKRVLDQIILKFQNRYIILYHINENLIISSLTKKNVQIGIATLLVEEAASKIAKIYNKH